MPFPTHISDIQPFVELHVSSWASVYKAYQPSLDRVVLLKVLNPVFSREEENANWFKSEAQLTAKVLHPNVVAVYGYGESKDGLYFTTEFVEGVTLREVIDRGQIPYPIAVFIIEQMLLGLQAAHKQGVLHRDLKPENVLISLDGYVKLCDFGFASTVGSSEERGDIRGTIGYIAPEVILEGSSDKGSDLFALGAIVYEMLLGMPAFSAQNTAEYLDKIQHHDPVSHLDACTFISAPLRALSRELLEKNPKKRIATTSEVLEAIRTIQDKERWRLSPEVLSEWWADPSSYQPRVLDIAPKPDLEPVSHVGPHKKRGLGWMWRSVLAIALVAVLIAFINGTGNQTKPIAAQETEDAGERVSLNSAQIALNEKDTLHGLPTTSAEENNTVAAFKSEIEEDPPTQPDLSPTSELVSTPTEALMSDSVAVEADSLGQVEPENGFITVFCLPSCTVQIGTENKGEAPPALTVPLSPGDYQIQLLNDDFPAYSERVGIREGRSDTLSVSLLETVGTLDLTVIPWGEVFIDSTSYGVFPPATPLRVWPGEHVLRVVHKELGERTLSFTIGKNEKLERTITFKD